MFTITVSAKMGQCTDRHDHLDPQPLSHRLITEIDPQSLFGAPYVQLYTLAETPKPPSHRIGLIYEGATYCTVLQY
jgi:hypothetical protein